MVKLVRNTYSCERTYNQKNPTSLCREIRTQWQKKTFPHPQHKAIIKTEARTWLLEKQCQVASNGYLILLLDTNIMINYVIICSIRYVPILQDLLQRNFIDFFRI